MQSPLQSPSVAGSPMSSVYQESRKSSQTSTSGLSGNMRSNLIYLLLFVDFLRCWVIKRQISVVPIDKGYPLIININK